MPKQKSSSLIRRILFILILAVAASLAVELFLRVFYPQTTLQIIEQRGKTLNIFSESSYLPWELSSGKHIIHIGPDNQKVDVNINLNGLRDDEKAYEKPKESYRILALDTFAFGFGVELNESYGKALELLLNKNSGTKKYEVINAGFAAGDSIDTAYLFLKNEGLKYKPDMVIFGYAPSNDLEEIEAHQWQADSYGIPASISYPFLFVDSEGNRASKNPEKESIFWSIHLFFSRQSHLYTYIKNKLKGTFIAAEFRRYNEPKGSGIYDENYSDSLESGWEKTKFLLLETNNLVKENNAVFAVMYIPDRVQSADSEWEEHVKVIGKASQKASRTKPQEMLGEFAWANGIEFMDLYPAFHENQAEGLYFQIDPHWTKAGHYLAAKTIYGELYGNQN